MNILTHGLASLALARAAWPRAPKQLWIVAVVAGVIADLDFASAWFGPAAYLTWHRTYTHSLLTSIIVAALFALVYRLLAKGLLREKFSALAVFPLALAAECLHLVMDVLGWEGTAWLWPFTARKFPMDWVANLDPFILIVLAGALLFPELLHLVSSEIGARDTKPRGKIGAIIGFAIIAVYVALRADFHSNVLALVESRTFRGELAKRTAAFPESVSPLEWRGIVDTERALHQLTITVGRAGSFDPESAETLFKPEASAALDAAGKTASAEIFLKNARFPKAIVEITPAGTRVELHDLVYSSVGDSSREVAAVVVVDATNRVVSQHLVWAKQQPEE